MVVAIPLNTGTINHTPTLLGVTPRIFEDLMTQTDSFFIMITTTLALTCYPIDPREFFKNTSTRDQ